MEDIGDIEVEDNKDSAHIEEGYTVGVAAVVVVGIFSAFIERQL